MEIELNRKFQFPVLLGKSRQPIYSNHLHSNIELYLKLKSSFNFLGKLISYTPSPFFQYDIKNVVRLTKYEYVSNALVILSDLL